MTITKLAITLGVADLAKSFAFYRFGLGFPSANGIQHFDGVTFAGFEMGENMFALLPVDALASDSGQSPTRSGFSRIAFTHAVATKAEADDIVAKALAAGGTMPRQPITRSWGHYSTCFNDLDGFCWEIVVVNPGE